MQDIEVQELYEKSKREESFLLIDVREQFEYSMYNLGGKLIPLSILSESFQDLQKFIDKEIVVICRSGMRSATAKTMMEEAGFKHVRNLLGGVLAWQRAGFLPSKLK